MRIQSGGEGCLDFRIQRSAGTMHDRRCYSTFCDEALVPKRVMYRPYTKPQSVFSLQSISLFCSNPYQFFHQKPSFHNLRRSSRDQFLVASKHCKMCSHSSSLEGFSDSPQEGGKSEESSSEDKERDLEGFEKALESSERHEGQVSESETSTSNQDTDVNQGPNKFMQVPWRGAVIWQVMMLWTFAYVIHPQWIIPIGLEVLAGIDRAQLSSRGEAFLHVALDLGMLGFTVAILWLCLKQYKPRALGWFRSRVWPPKWMLKVLLACAIGFPLAMYLGDFSQLLIPNTDVEVWNYLHLEETLAAGDKITNAMYFLVLTICAPVWEEVIFRGFLMPSLTKYMPPWGAVSLTALIFACIHFSYQRFLPLLVLGVVFGGLYAESKNLLTAITAHSLWNMCVFAQVLYDSPPGQKLAF